MAKTRQLIKFGLQGADRSLARAASLSSEKAQPIDHKPIFIVGGPRSGSTLVSQVMISRFHLAYINNVVAQFPQSASTIAKVLRVGSWPVPDQTESLYGDTRGPNGPSEAGAIWDWIFPWSNHHSVSETELTDESASRLLKLVSGLTQAYRAPLLTKNLWNSVRIPAISRAIPSALFVVMLRDPIEMTDSIMRGRARALGEQPGFWSIRPRELLMDPPDDPLQHVIRQIHLTYREIDQAIQNANANQFFFLRYESFCNNPSAELERFETFASQRGQMLIPRKSPPPQLTVRAGSVENRHGHESVLYDGLPEWFRSKYPAHPRKLE